MLTNATEDGVEVLKKGIKYRLLSSNVGFLEFKNKRTTILKSYCINNK